MLPQEIIRKKRDNEQLSLTEIQEFISGILNGKVSESHISAFTMAVFFNGMNTDECIALTEAMMNSGDVLNWNDLNGPVIDKHSTGGVGDKVSIMLSPIIASCGIYNPMISGRGLGHTGGTLDKLESIPGYNTTPNNLIFREIVKNVGCAIIGQTANLAPVDKVIYGVRDVTATVESIPLITASILSKKLSAGLNGLVMDIKLGNGAFATDITFANGVGKNIIQVANHFAMKTTALITDMNQPLGHSIGNALEIIEVIEYLNCTKINPRLHEVVMALSAEILLNSKIVNDKESGIQMANEALQNGKAGETFEKMVSELGGPNNILQNKISTFTNSPIIKPVKSDKTGVITKIDTRALGLAVVELGGGRKKTDDIINHSVGLTNVLGLGEKIINDQDLAIIHAQTEDQFKQAEKIIQNAYNISDVDIVSTPTIIEYLD
ncbi:MAG: thymidine phosphorylase [Candidatus Marinimicrobia bacterium]|nr:thymidine phosphorylase [Candidatus Neomarinimicrobiota bacterium]